MLIFFLLETHKYQYSVGCHTCLFNFQINLEENRYWCSVTSYCLLSSWQQHSVQTTTYL